MGVGENFQAFCGNLTINNRTSIGNRYQLITRRLNLDFWNQDSKTNHSLYVGSYGRGTAIRGFSDLDMIFQLPYAYYQKYNAYSSNGQSAMLQDVKRSLQKTYSSTDIGGDGQVVVIRFNDGIRFEIVPAFANTDGSYTYPDSNNGGRWKTTNPKPEINAISSMDIQCNNNLKRLCRVARAWRNKWDAPMGGLLIDTLAYRFITNWEYRDKSYLYYDWMSRDFLKYLSDEPERSYWQSVGSKQFIWNKGKFQYKSKRCYNIALEAISHESANPKREWSAKQKWREIFGTSFPS